MTKTELLKAERAKEREQKLAEKKRQQDYDRAIALGEQYKITIAKMNQLERESEMLKKEVANLLVPYSVDGGRVYFGVMMLYKQALPVSVSMAHAESELQAFSIIRKTMPQAIKQKIDWELVRKDAAAMRALAEVGIAIQKSESWRIK